MWGPSLADAKISQLPDGGTIQPSDQVPVNRAGTTVRATGAGAVPATWTFDPVTGALTIDSSASDVTIPVRVVAGSGATVGFDLRFDPSLPGIRLQGLDASGAVVLSDDFSAQQTEVASGAILVQEGTDSVSINSRSIAVAVPGGPTTHDPGRKIGYADASTSKDLAAVSPRGVKIGVNIAPGDADLQPGTAYLWFQSTDGSAKLMITAKQDDGTVKSGSVTLS